MNVQLPPFDKCIDELRQRDWNLISQQWLVHVPDISVGDKPDPSLGEFLSIKSTGSGILQKQKEYLKKELASLRAGNVQSPVPTDCRHDKSIGPDARTILLWEGLFLVHKCMHVQSRAEVSASEGFLTWSLADAYEASLFGTRALLSLLGIGIVRVDDRDFFLDVWPDLTTKKVPESCCLINTFSGQIGHSHVWQLLQRALEPV